MTETPEPKHYSDFELHEIEQDLNTFAEPCKHPTECKNKTPDHKHTYCAGQWKWYVKHGVIREWKGTMSIRDIPKFLEMRNQFDQLINLQRRREFAQRKTAEAHAP